MTWLGSPATRWARIKSVHRGADPTVHAHLRALLGHASDILVVLNADGNLLVWMPNHALGYPDDAFVGGAPLDIVHPGDHGRANAVLTQALDRPGYPVGAELRLRHADGSWRRFEIRVTNQLHDPLVRGIVINGCDITERRSAEEKLRAMEAEVRAEQRRTQYAVATSAQLARAVIESLNGPVIVLDADGKIIAANDEWEQYLVDVGGKPERARIGADYLALCDNAAAQFVEGAAEIGAGIRAVLSGAQRLIRVDYPARGVRDGRWYALRAAPLATESGGVVVHQIDITDRKRYEEQLTHAALHDSLTGLPNRALVQDRIDNALRRTGPGRFVGVLFMDIDHFKVLNDARGHSAGDRLLIALAERLMEMARPGDTVARFGGDEFVMLCEDLHSPDELPAIAAQVVDGLAAPFDDDQQFAVTVSVGIALGEHSSNGATLLRDADAAMYRAKEEGRNRYAFFDEELRSRVLARLTTESELRAAIENNELCIHYQPVIDLHTGAIVGAEALARWQHPQRGIVGPAQFISVAEESGLVLPMGRFVLRATCNQARHWRALWPDHSLGVSVNLSPLQLARPGIVNDVAGALHAAGLDGDQLALELTETALVDARHAPVAKLHALRNLGVRIAIDDFGTGYSSLSRLKQFPIHSIKIDQSFVAGLGSDSDDDAIVAATLAMASTLGLAVIAEGIENEAQRRALLRLGCRYGQGFCFGVPMPADELTQRLEQQAQSREFATAAS